MPRPPRGYEIDWTNPLADGLELAVLHADEGNLVSGGIDYGVNFVNAGDEGFRFEPTTPPGNTPLHGPNVTVFSEIIRTASYEGFRAILFPPGYFANQGDQFSSGFQGRSNDFRALVFARDNNGFPSLNSNVVLSLNSPSAIALSLGDDRFKAYQSGSLLVESNYPFRTDLRKQGPRLAESINTSANVFLGWSRALNDEEHAQVAANPYQLFRPRRLSRRRSNNVATLPLIAGIA